VPDTKETSSDALGKLKRSFKQILGTKEYKLYKVLEEYESLQACKDLSLTGELEERLIATCRLGEFGFDALDGLEIAVLDDNDAVRALAVVMTGLVAGSLKEQDLKKLTSDSNPKVKAAAEFTIDWIQNAPVNVPNLLGDNGLDHEAAIIHDDEIPLRTSDTVFIKNDYSAGVDNIEFEVTVINESEDTITNVEVRLLAFPNESLHSPDEMRIVIDEIKGTKSKRVSFTFKAFNECIEGEMITSVTFTEPSGERVSAKAGNCFVRSFYDWIAPVELSKKTAEKKRKKLKQWGREHQVTRDPNELYEMFMQTFEAMNLHIYHKEKDDKSKAFMGSIYGIGKGQFTKLDIVASILLVGDSKEKVSKVRMDVYSDNPEILHTAASELYEMTLRLLGEL